MAGQYGRATSRGERERPRRRGGSSVVGGDEQESRQDRKEEDRIEMEETALRLGVRDWE